MSMNRPIRLHTVSTLVLWLVVLTGTALGAIRLNEVLYDAEGADGGHEFVELISISQSSISLAGYRLQFANGSVGEQWATRWTGTADDVLGPGALFLICDKNWSGEASADAIGSLGLQNGPDAVSLLAPDGTRDILGYGQLDWPGLYETEPHPGCPSGASLGRFPDGNDTDSNTADWRILEKPTPGAFNAHRHALKLLEMQVSPPNLLQPGSLHLQLSLENTGLLTLGPGPAWLSTSCADNRVSLELPLIAPDETASLAVVWSDLEIGRHEFSLHVPIGTDNGEDLVLTLGRYHVGPPELILSEVMAVPQSDGCEWIEVQAVGDTLVDLADYCLADHGGPSRPLADLRLAPGELRVLVQDVEVFRSWWLARDADDAPWACPPPSLDYLSQGLPDGWPALNNSSSADRDFADLLLLSEAASGLVVDHVYIGAENLDLPQGRSLERAAAVPSGIAGLNWGLSTAATGSTPGCPNSLSHSGYPDPGLSAVPNPFTGVTHGGTGVSLAFEIPQRAQGWSLDVYDLFGRRFRTFLGDMLGPGPRTLHWDGIDDAGRGCGCGPMIAVLGLVAADGRVVGSDKLLMVCSDGHRH
jgi:Lamin Tail Domain